MDINPKTRWLRGLLGLLLALAALMVVDLWRLSHIHGWNRAIADGSVVSLEGVLPPEAQFAKAFVLERRGAHQRALSLYKEIDATEHRDLAAAANYNSANIYLRWALELHAQEGERQAMPLFELAKQSYRDLLRSHDQLWDARYNLERALRLFPDSGGQTDAAGPSPLHSERAITTMRGFTLGLP